jgi:hypothetical protein
VRHLRLVTQDPVWYADQVKRVSVPVKEVEPSYDGYPMGTRAAMCLEVNEVEDRMDNDPNAR